MRHHRQRSYSLRNILLIFFITVINGTLWSQVERQGTLFETIKLPSAKTTWQRLSPIQLITSLAVLSADSLEGRKTGSRGNQRAQQFLVRQFSAFGLQSFNGSFAQSFKFVPRSQRNYGTGNGQHSETGINIIGYLPGQRNSKLAIIITAHYDHEGVRSGETYNGANDNSSGVSAMLAAAGYFSRHLPDHTIIFAALDAEETGLNGARAFVRNPPFPLKNIALNINMDMISPAADSLLYISGTDHFPQLSKYVAAVSRASFLKVIPGHNSLDDLEDWTYSSDHAPFYYHSIPFLYLGVEDKAHYHKPSDTFENINQPFFLEASEVMLELLINLDRDLSHLHIQSGRQ